MEDDLKQIYIQLHSTAHTSRQVCGSSSSCRLHSSCNVLGDVVNKQVLHIFEVIHKELNKGNKHWSKFTNII